MEFDSLNLQFWKKINLIPKLCKRFNELSDFMLENESKIIPNTFTDREFDDFIYDNFY